MSDKPDDVDVADRLNKAKARKQRREKTKQRHDANGEATHDSGDDDITIQRLAALRVLDYERVRDAAARQLGCRVGMLDRIVAIARGDGAGDTKGQGRPLDLPLPVPWKQGVDGARLLHSIAYYLSRHLVLPSGAHHAMALWCLHCHCFEGFTFTPRLQFKAPSKGAGKSTALALIKPVLPKALETETISPAFLYRAIELVRPTLLLDEADTYLRDDDDLRGIINAGCKLGGQAGRCVGDSQEPRMFSCHAPVALAGIGSLPGTIEDRSIKVLMKRRRRGEAIRPIDARTLALGEGLQRKAARWACDHATELHAARPDMGKLFNRAADRWRALYAIADAAGGDWPALARKAMQAIAGADDDDADSLGERLLADVKAIFDDACPRTELETREIVERLVLMDNRPWPEMGRSHKPLTTTRFTQMVGKFGILRRRAYDPATQKMGAWGYRLIDFDDAFGRYLDG
jgi:putative DNA primase/helicase